MNVNINGWYSLKPRRFLWFVIGWSDPKPINQTVKIPAGGDNTIRIGPISVTIADDTHGGILFTVSIAGVPFWTKHYEVLPAHFRNSHGDFKFDVMITEAP